jgi:hypothetical protein
MPVARKISSHTFNSVPSTYFRSKREAGVPSTAAFPSPPTIYQLYPDQAGPWQHMAQTYAWVVEQELRRKNKETELWLLSQQIFPPEESKKGTGKTAEGRKREVNENLKQRMVEELMYAYEVEADKWMKREEEARRAAIEREKERKARKAKIAQEQARRVQARQIKEQERIKQLRASEREARSKSDEQILDAWRTYETQWAEISTSSGPLTFQKIPWPVSLPPPNLSGLTPASIVMFLFSSLHSQGQSRKERVRSALLRWHPDRFRRLLSRVTEAEKSAVEEGVGIVARCLNDLMARETSIAKHVRTLTFPTDLAANELTTCRQSR